MGRSILAVVAGAVLAIFIITLLEYLSHSLYPLPPGISMDNPAMLREYMYNAPIEMYLLILLGYVLASFAGGFLASFISHHHHLRNGLIVGVLLTGAGIANMLGVPHAPWFWISVVLYLPFAWAGSLIGKRLDRRPMTAEEESLV